MTNVLPVQEFQIGQRVRPANGQPAFIIGMICAGAEGEGLRYYGPKWSGLASELTLAPERPPYVPSERRVLSLSLLGGCPENYRCETDAELFARHIIERAAYDAQGEGE